MEKNIFYFILHTLFNLFCVYFYQFLRVQIFSWTNNPRYNFRNMPKKKNISSPKKEAVVVQEKIEPIINEDRYEYTDEIDNVLLEGFVCLPEYFLKLKFYLIFI